MQRASGFYAGKGSGIKVRATHTEQSFSFADAVRVNRMRVKREAVYQRIPAVVPPFMAVLWIWLIRHCKYDPSAWYLSAKQIEDGLCDAGVIGSDRFGVYATGGRCCQTTEEGRAVLLGRDLLDTGRPGALVEITDGAP
jgi:hypothetical protein